MQAQWSLHTHAPCNAHPTRVNAKKCTHAQTCTKEEASPVGLLSNSEHMIDCLRNCSSEKHFMPRRERDSASEFGVGESERESVLHNLCAAVKMHDIGAPCITP